MSLFPGTSAPLYVVIAFPLQLIAESNFSHCIFVQMLLGSQKAAEGQKTSLIIPEQYTDVHNLVPYGDVVCRCLTFILQYYCSVSRATFIGKDGTSIGNA